MRLLRFIVPVLVVLIIVVGCVFAMIGTDVEEVTLLRVGEIIDSEVGVLEAHDLNGPCCVNQLSELEHDRASEHCLSSEHGETNAAPTATRLETSRKGTRSPGVWSGSVLKGADREA